MSSPPRTLSTALGALLLLAACDVATLIPPDGSLAADAPARACQPGAGRCDGATLLRCGEDSTWAMEERCADGCSPTLGCTFCRAGEYRCDGSVSTRCREDGSGFVPVRDCAEHAAACGPDGFCQDACAEPERSGSFTGCEHWASPLPSSIQRSRLTFRVVVGNPGTTPARVRVTRGGDLRAEVEVPPGEARDVVLPFIDGLSTLESDPWTSTVRSLGAYRVLSDVPVTATQFVPFEAEGTVFSADASLLVPSHALGESYVVVTAPSSSVRWVIERDGVVTSDERIRAPGYAAIVGVSPQPTRVEIEASAPIAADPEGRFGALRRGERAQLVVARGDVVILATEVPPHCTESTPGVARERECAGAGCAEWQRCPNTDFDLSGTRISASAPVAVFGAHASANVPFGVSAADHLEAQLLPVRSFATELVSAPLGPLRANARNVVRIVAREPGTRVTVEPASLGIAPLEIGALGVAELEIDAPFRLVASAPILAAQLLVSAEAYDVGDDPGFQVGDPAMTVIVPRARFLRDASFVVPSSYAEAFVSILRAPGVEVRLDDRPVEAAWAPIGELETATVPVGPGAHRVRSTAPIGAQVFGLGESTSFAYPAGFDLAFTLE